MPLKLPKAAELRTVENDQYKQILFSNCTLKTINLLTGEEHIDLLDGEISDIVNDFDEQFNISNDDSTKQANMVEK